MGGGKCLDDGTHAPMGRGVDPSMKCDVASSTTAYTEVKGYMLNMATFDGGSFFANGSAMASMTTASMTTDMIASMTTASANKDAPIATHATTIAKLEKDKVKSVLIMDQQETPCQRRRRTKCRRGPSRSSSSLARCFSWWWGTWASSCRGSSKASRSSCQPRRRALEPPEGLDCLDAARFSLDEFPQDSGSRARDVRKGAENSDRALTSLVEAPDL